MKGKIASFPVLLGGIVQSRMEIEERDVINCRRSKIKRVIPFFFGNVIRPSH
ncbi:hypothetical protein LINPERPRIM_LOCUS41658, partial [Linum perenne]